MNRFRIFKGILFVFVISAVFGLGIRMSNSYAGERGLQLKHRTVKVGGQISFQNVRGDETFRSGNPAVAYVNRQGVVTGKREGKVTITVRRDGKKVKSVRVTVKKVKYRPWIAVCSDEIQRSAVYLTERGGETVFAVDVKNLSRKYAIKKLKLKYNLEVAVKTEDAAAAAAVSVSATDAAVTDTVQHTKTYTASFSCKKIKKGKTRTLYCSLDEMSGDMPEVTSCEETRVWISSQKAFMEEHENEISWGYNTKDKKPPVFRGFIGKNSYHNKDIYMVMYPDSDWSFKKYVSARDNRDGKIAFSVDTTHVNRSKKGVYKVFFKATDSSGNVAKAWAKIQVRQVTGIDSYADTILKRITKKGWSDVSKCKAIYAYVKSHMSYVDYDGGGNWESSALRAVRYNNGNCYAYYSLSRLLMTRAGIPNMMITRYPAIAHHHHWWNLAYVEGGWYHFDTVSRRRGGRFCLLTEAQIKQYSRVDSYAFQFPSNAYPKRATKKICPGPF